MLWDPVRKVFQGRLTNFRKWTRTTIPVRLGLLNRS